MSLSRRILYSLSRTTSGRPLIPEIDGLRFLALLPVILFHLWGNFTNYAKGVFAIPSFAEIPAAVLCVDDGKMGVKLFFIISGFILGLPFARYHLEEIKKVSIRHYFKRRLVRLEPPYIINLFLLFFILSLIKPEFKFLESFQNLLASVFYLHNFIYEQQSIINTVAWSLEIEVQFYLMVPLLSLLFTINSKIIRRILLVAGIMLGTIASQHLSGTNRFSLSILNYSQYFLIGFLLVEIYLANKGKIFVRNLFYDMLMLVSVAGFFALGLLTNRYELLAPWLGLMIAISAFKGTISNRVFSNPWIFTIGGMCYTIYLYHFSIIGFMGHGMLFWFESFWANFLITFTLVPAVVLVVSSCLFVTLERPFMGDWHQLIAKSGSYSKNWFSKKTAPLAVQEQREG